MHQGASIYRVRHHECEAAQATVVSRQPDRAVWNHEICD